MSLTSWTFSTGADVSAEPAGTLYSPEANKSTDLSSEKESGVRGLHLVTFDEHPYQIAIIKLNSETENSQRSAFRSVRLSLQDLSLSCTYIVKDVYSIVRKDFEEFTTSFVDLQD